MSIVDTIVDFLGDEDVGYEHDAALNVVRFHFSNETNGWLVTIHPLEESSQIVVLSHFSSAVAEEFRPGVAEFVLRVNCELLVGGFDFGLDDGMLRFRTAMDVDDIDVSTAVVRNLVYSNVSTMDLHIGALNRLVHGGVGVDEAIQILESSIRE